MNCTIEIELEQDGRWIAEVVDLLSSRHVRKKCVKSQRPGFRSPCRDARTYRINPSN